MFLPVILKEVYHVWSTIEIKISKNGEGDDFRQKTQRLCKFLGKIILDMEEK